MYGYSPITYLEGEIEVNPQVRSDGYHEITCEGLETAHVASSAIDGLAAALVGTMNAAALENLEGAIRNRWMELER